MFILFCYPVPDGKCILLEDALVVEQDASSVAALGLLGAQLPHADGVHTATTSSSRLLRRATACSSQRTQIEWLQQRWDCHIFFLPWNTMSCRSWQSLISNRGNPQTLFGWVYFPPIFFCIMPQASESESAIVFFLFFFQFVSDPGCLSPPLMKKSTCPFTVLMPSVLVQCITCTICALSLLTLLRLRLEFPRAGFTNPGTLPGGYSTFLSFCFLARFFPASPAQDKRETHKKKFRAFPGL